MDKQKVKWTPTAINSLKAIVNFYNKRNKNNEYSKKITAKMKKTISLLPTNNFLGKSVENSDLRVLIQERHHLFYKVNPEVIEIRLVWDCRQNPDDLENEMEKEC